MQRCNHQVHRIDRYNFYLSFHFCYGEFWQRYTFITNFGRASWGYIRMCLVPHHEEVWGIGVIAPPFFTVALDGGKWSDSHLIRFTARLDRRLDGPQSRFGHCGVEKNLLPCRESNPDRLNSDSALCDWMLRALWVTGSHNGTLLRPGCRDAVCSGHAHGV
jgi:hypothetical protein